MASQHHRGLRPALEAPAGRHGRRPLGALRRHHARAQVPLGEPVSDHPDWVLQAAGGSIGAARLLAVDLSAGGRPRGGSRNVDWSRDSSAARRSRSGSRRARGHEVLPWRTRCRARACGVLLVLALVLPAMAAALRAAVGASGFAVALGGIGAGPPTRAPSSPRCSWRLAARDPCRARPRVRPALQGLPLRGPDRPRDGTGRRGLHGRAGDRPAPARRRSPPPACLPAPRCSSSPTRAPPTGQAVWLALLFVALALTALRARAAPG